MDNLDNINVPVQNRFDVFDKRQINSENQNGQNVGISRQDFISSSTDGKLLQIFDELNFIRNDQHSHYHQEVSQPTNSAHSIWGDSMVSDDHLSSRQLSSGAGNSMLNSMVIDESHENTNPKHTGYAKGELNKHETFSHQLLNKDITCHSQYTANVGSEIVNEIERSTENVSGNQQCVFSQLHSNVNTSPIRSEPSVRDTNISNCTNNERSDIHFGELPALVSQSSTVLNNDSESHEANTNSVAFINPLSDNTSSNNLSFKNQITSTSKIGDTVNVNGCGDKTSNNTPHVSQFSIGEPNIVSDHC
ncbi:hypothetical protein ACF0H5_002428 [Mactra antiquata]